MAPKNNICYSSIFFILFCIFPQICLGSTIQLTDETNVNREMINVSDCLKQFDLDSIEMDVSYLGNPDDIGGKIIIKRDGALQFSRKFDYREGPFPQNSTYVIRKLSDSEMCRIIELIGDYFITKKKSIIQKFEKNSFYYSSGPRVLSIKIYYNDNGFSEAPWFKHIESISFPFIGIQTESAERTTYYDEGAGELYEITRGDGEFRRTE